MGRDVTTIGRGGTTFGPGFVRLLTGFAGEGAGWALNRELSGFTGVDIPHGVTFEHRETAITFLAHTAPMQIPNRVQYCEVAAQNPAYPSLAIEGSALKILQTSILD